MDPTLAAPTLAAPGDYAWVPTPEQLARANATRLARVLGCDGHQALHRVSLDEPDRFWRAVRDDIGIPLARDWDDVVDTSRGIEWATWFLGARLNVAEACVHRWAAERPDEEAAVWEPEDGGRRSLTWAELSRETRRLAEALVELGIRPGDAVGIFLPMAPEAAIASHACAHVGAIQVPIFSGFAAPAISARLTDARAKLLITADATFRRGKLVPMKEVADEALAEAPSVERVLVWTRSGVDCPWMDGRDVRWEDAVEGQPGELPAAELEAEHPLPARVHVGDDRAAEGSAPRPRRLPAFDRPRGRLPGRPGRRATACFSPPTWVGSWGPGRSSARGAVGATIVFTEGAPDWPADRLWRLVERERVTMLGVSPTLVRALIPKGEPQRRPVRRCARLLRPASRGTVEPYHWLHEHVGGGRPDPDREHLRRHRGRRLLPVAVIP